VSPAKHALRLWSRRVRDAIPARDAGRAAELAASALLGLEPVRSAAILAIYARVASELDTMPAIRALLAAGRPLAFPRVVDGDRRLRFHRVGDPAELTPGSFGIPEPDQAAPIVPVERIDAFVVPGLAFDRQGSRLGWGKGHYDHTLAAHPSAVRIGYAYERQLVGLVPCEADDAAMDTLITEAGVYDCRRGRGVL
jgi:5-formyltetrahydrofolate cyclo-ligase